MGQQQEGRPSCFTLPPSYSKNDFTTRTIISESHLKSCLLFALPYSKSISLLFLMGYTTRSKCSLEDFQDCITLFIVRYSTRLSFKNGICIENHLLHLFLRHLFKLRLSYASSIPQTIYNFNAIYSKTGWSYTRKSIFHKSSNTMSTTIHWIPSR